MHHEVTSLRTSTAALSSGSSPLPTRKIGSFDRAAIKRVLDIVAAAGGLVILTPVLLLVAAVIVCDDRFPVLFRQWRVGKNGRLFQLLKFRSMGANLPGSEITARRDARVTRVGKVLRRLKLDELPQLWNVIKGEMSLIGPRPEVPAFVDFSNPVWNAVVRTRPGITDLASLVYRNEEELLEGRENPEIYYREVVLPAKLELNLYYLQNSSFWLDLKLLMLTVRYSLFPAGFDPDKVKLIFTDRRVTIESSGALKRSLCQICHSSLFTVRRLVKRKSLKS